MITTPNNFRDNYVVVLDSLDRDLAKYPDPANYVIALPETLRNVETIELMSFQITRTETNVNSGNNKFLIIEIVTNSIQNTQPITNFYPIEIPIGEYSSSQLLQALKNSLAAVNSLASAAATNANYDAEFDNPTSIILKLFRSRTCTSLTDIVTFGIQIEESAAKLFGIAGTGMRGSGLIQSAFVNSGSVPSTGITGRNAIDLRGIPYLILYLNDYERIIAPGSHAHKNFLVVPMEDKPVGTRFIISGDQKEKKGIYILTNNQKNIYEMRVTIRRPDGTLYDFKGTDHLLIFRVYRHDYRDFNS